MLDGLWRLLLNRESLFGIHGHDKLYTRIDGWCERRESLMPSGQRVPIGKKGCSWTKFLVK